MTPVTPLRQPEGDDRRAGRDQTAPVGTSGEFLGISGQEREALFVYWLIAIAIGGSICLFDVLTRRHDAPGQNPLDPIIDEGSSWLMMTIVVALPAAAVIWTRRRCPALWRAALVHASALLTYSVFHVSGFVWIRKLGFSALLGQPYHFGPVAPEFLYEFGKDSLAYIMAAAGCWLVLQWRVSPGPTLANVPGSPVFDIRDGARLIRAPTAQIVAVRSAGNYAEFVLADGRRPLMRSSLGALEEQLAPRGFVRTHRSWLVNSARVTGLRPAGSGDHVVELGELEAPLSRRFRNALATLRA